MLLLLPPVFKFNLHDIESEKKFVVITIDGF